MANSKLLSSARLFKSRNTRLRSSKLWIEDLNSQLLSTKVFWWRCATWAVWCLTGCETWSNTQTSSRRAFKITAVTLGFGRIRKMKWSPTIGTNTSGKNSSSPSTQLSTWERSEASTSRRSTPPHWCTSSSSFALSVLNRKRLQKSSRLWRPLRRSSRNEWLALKIKLPIRRSRILFCQRWRSQTLRNRTETW